MWPKDNQATQYIAVFGQLMLTVHLFCDQTLRLEKSSQCYWVVKKEIWWVMRNLYLFSAEHLVKTFPNRSKLELKKWRNNAFSFPLCSSFIQFQHSFLISFSEWATHVFKSVIICEQTAEFRNANTMSWQQ